MPLSLATRSKVAMGAALAVLAVAGCSTGSTPTQPTSPSPTPVATAPESACDDLAKLRSSLDALTKFDFAQGGLPALQSAINDVKTDLAAAEAAASPVLQPSVQQVKTAFDSLQTATAGLTPDNRREKLPAIATSVVQVVTATQALNTTIREHCPGR